MTQTTRGDTLRSHMQQQRRGGGDSRKRGGGSRTQQYRCPQGGPHHHPNTLPGAKTGAGGCWGGWGGAVPLGVGEGGLYLGETTLNLVVLIFFALPFPPSSAPPPPPPVVPQAAKLPMSIIIVGVGQAEFDGKAGGGGPQHTPVALFGGGGGGGGPQLSLATGGGKGWAEFVGAQRDSRLWL